MGIPKEARNGDYAANHAMTGARALRMAPRRIAEILVEKLDLTDSYFASVEIAGPGFLNFRLAKSWYAAVLSAVESEGAAYGRRAERTGEKVMVEFSRQPHRAHDHRKPAAACWRYALHRLDMAGASDSGILRQRRGQQVDKFGRSIESATASF